VSQGKGEEDVFSTKSPQTIEAEPIGKHVSCNSNSEGTGGKPNLNFYFGARTQMNKKKSQNRSHVIEASCQRAVGSRGGSSKGGGKTLAEGGKRWGSIFTMGPPKKNSNGEGFAARPSEILSMKENCGRAVQRIDWGRGGVRFCFLNGDRGRRNHMNLTTWRSPRSRVGYALGSGIYFDR